MIENKTRPRQTFKPETFKTPKPMAFKGDGHQFIGMTEPEWPSAIIQKAWTRAEYETKLQEAYRWYNATQTIKIANDLAMTAISLSKHGSKIATILKASAENMPPTVAWLFRMMHMGMVIRYREARAIAKAIRHCAAHKKQHVAKSPTKANVQDTVAQQIHRIKGEFDAAFDSFMESGYQKSNKTAIEILKEQSLSNSGMKDLVGYATQYLHEYKEVLDGKDEVLLEGYSAVGKRNIKAAIAWWEKIINDICVIGQLKTGDRKPRTKKKVSPEKIVSKLKYLKKYDNFDLTSIDPTFILKSNELWVFNTRTRKIGKYIALNKGVLEVKGTKLSNIDPVKSVQKTLRKPVEQLAEFNKLGKVEATVWFENVKAVSTPLRESIGVETILLKGNK